MIRGIGPQGRPHSGLICLPIQSPRMLQSVESAIVHSTFTRMFGTLFSARCKPHLGAQPVSAVANADRPDSLLVTSEV